MELAKKHGCKTIAFPLISAGVYGYPKEQALKIAVDTISEFLKKNEMLVYIVAFDSDIIQIAETVFPELIKNC